MMAYELWFLLFFVAIFAGFIDAAAGGGGLITLPALLFAGISPTQSLGTNKLQACFGTFSAAWHFARKGMISPNRMITMVIVVACSAILGAFAVQLVDNRFLLLIMPIALIAIALYSFLSKTLGAQTTVARLTDRQFSATASPAVGFYDGFFGPGTGTFFAIAFVKWRGFDFVKATAHAKVLNFTSNISALLLFSLSGQVLLGVGLLMALGQAIGAKLGASMVINKGAGFVRILTTIVCIAISISLVIKNLFG